MVENVGKSFRSYRSEFHRFLNWFGCRIKPAEEHWVLRNISFSLEPGEAIGLVGFNGAGKSTLLKMIAGTLAPTEGAVTLNGSIAAILELGMGFNPELTGRQNAVHACGLLGFSVDEVNKALPEIQAFAEIGEYFEEPVRVYSSGMQVRVAFAVVTARRPEILIVDEALSVGDAYFQHKSFEKIKEFQRLGTSLIIVSHDKNAIQTLCGRALLIDKGKLAKDGSAEEVFDFYNALLASTVSDVQTLELPEAAVQTISGTGEVTLEKVRILNPEGNEVETIVVGEMVTLLLTAVVNKTVDRLVMGYGIKDRLGRVLFGTNTHYTNQELRQVAPGETLEFTITFIANFGIGSYSVQTAFVSGKTHLENNYEWQDFALMFDVINAHKPVFEGCMWHESKIEVGRFKEPKY